MLAFGPLSTLFHDTGLAQASVTEVDWYAARLPPDTGPTLEPMCGSGRVLAPLMTHGHHVHGVDTSAAMIASCEARLASLALSTMLFRQDITQLNVPFRYKCAYVTAGSFQLITDPAAAAGTLARIHAHLVPPGLLFLDCYVPADATQRLGAPLVEVRTVKLADGTQIALRSETTCWADARLSRAENRYAHRRAAKLLAEEHETVTSTWYTAEEITTLVEEAGFGDVSIAPSPRDGKDAKTFMLTARL